MAPIAQKRTHDNNVALSSFLKKTARRTRKKTSRENMQLSKRGMTKRWAVIKPREKHTTMGTRGRFIAGFAEKFMYSLNFVIRHSLFNIRYLPSYLSESLD